MQVAIAEAKAQFAELVRRAEAGEAIELTRYGRPVACLVPVARPAIGALIGAMAGRFAVPDPAEGDAAVAALFADSAMRDGRVGDGG